MVAQIAPVAGRPAESPIFSLRLWHACRVHSGALRPLLGALKERKTKTTDGQPITSVEPQGNSLPTCKQASVPRLQFEP